MLAQNYCLHPHHFRVFLRRDPFQHIAPHLRMRLRLRQALLHGLVQRDARQDGLNERFPLVFRPVLRVPYDFLQDFLLPGEKSAASVAAEALDEEHPDLLLLSDAHKCSLLSL